MLTLYIIGALATGIVLAGLWVRHRQRSVDDYFEREYRDPPAGIPPTW